MHEENVSNQSGPLPSDAPSRRSRAFWSQSHAAVPPYASHSQSPATGLQQEAEIGLRLNREGVAKEADTGGPMPDAAQ